ncbi:permease family protein [Halalkalicoccus paucihalophilus]|uniref:Permease family protein n=1 Tax=Halalkalicoccus paucihalophilus TaxID=1008153 RepID=A0A151ACL3_9EURY|nr:NCS2 family permease [Halalkalicoccus paucihalophilus]KYH25280.1 permease family protein [Halalkalicoccus paucihalophilus]
MGIGERVGAYFDVGGQGSDVRTETVAGITTFLAMSYIVLVNPIILAEAITIEGYSTQDVQQMIAIATILSAFVATLVMAVYARRPFALAPGMGLNAFFAFTVVLGLGIPWQTALAAVFVEGLIFIAITAVGARKYVIELFPEPVKFSVGAGIGIFLLFIGLQEMQLVVADEATLVALGDVAASPVAGLGVLGLAVTFVLWARGIKGAIVIGIVGTTVLGWLLTFAGVFERGVITPETLVSPQYDITPLAGAFFGGLADIDPLTFTLVVFTFFFVDFFDTAGTLIGVSQFGGFLDEEGDLPEVEKPLMADAIGTTVGAMLGTSTVTTYIESSTGIEEGGRTGLTALVVAGLFLASLVAVPLIAAIPAYASYIALVVVGIIMLQGVLDVDWNDPAWAVSGGLTITVMPLTYSIANGLAAGIIAYPVIKAAVGDFEDVRPGQWVLAAALVGYFYVQTSGMFF